MLLGFIVLKKLFVIIIRFAFFLNLFFIISTTITITQILILIPYQYNSYFLYFLLHIYIFLKIFGGDIFHMHKGQNVEFLLINICVVFVLLVLF